MGPIETAFRSGDKKDTLFEMGVKMAQIMDESDGIRDFAPAIKRMCEIMDDIEKCPDKNRQKTKLEVLQANAAKRKSA